MRADAFFQSIKKAAGPRARNMTLHIETGRAVNAYVNSAGEVHIYAGMLLFTENDPDQIAGVIGHEIAHHLLGHTGPLGFICRTSDAGSQMCEKQSDIVGMRLMKKAGFNECRAAEIWLRMYYRWGNVGGTSHPKVLDRYNYTRCRK